MKVLMLSSEATPFFKSGGLADVVGDLSRKLPLFGADVRVLLPAYGMAPSDAGELEAVVSVRVLGGARRIEIRTRILDGARFCFVCDPLFTGRKGIYGPSSFEPFADNFLRFAILDKAAPAFCEAAGWIPDIFHCHDWTAGLLPFLLRKAASPVFKDARTLFTIHNLAYQGEFPRFEFINAMETPEPDIVSGRSVNLLRAGLIYSDHISTVSPTYAREIQTPAQGCGLDGILRSRKDSLCGILNGIDNSVWDPERDRHLPCAFGPDRLEGKARIKASVQRRHGLAEDARRPLFVMVSRLAVQKGVEELAEALAGLLGKEDAQFLVIGTGDKRYEEALASLARLHPNLAVRLVFSEEEAHLAVAAGDFLLMPSRYEPCGLSQMHSLRYGTLPVANRTGGLADSIKDLAADPEGGTGFLMEGTAPATIARAIEKAVSIYGSPLFQRARVRAMEQDFSWDSSARKYIALYEKIKGGGKQCR